MAVTPALRAALNARRASSAFFATGLSTSMWIPAAASRSIGGRGVAIRGRDERDLRPVLLDQRVKVRFERDAPIAFRELLGQERVDEVGLQRPAHLGVWIEERDDLDLVRELLEALDPAGRVVVVDADDRESKPVHVPLPFSVRSMLRGSPLRGRLPVPAGRPGPSGRGRRLPHRSPRRLRRLTAPGKPAANRPSPPMLVAASPSARLVPARPANPVNFSARETPARSLGLTRRALDENG